MLVEFIWLNIEPPIFMGYMAANAIRQIATLTGIIFLHHPYHCMIVMSLAIMSKIFVLSVFFESEPFCLAIGLV